MRKRRCVKPTNSSLVTVELMFSPELCSFLLNETRCARTHTRQMRTHVRHMINFYALLVRCRSMCSVLKAYRRRRGKLLAFERSATSCQLKRKKKKKYADVNTFFDRFFILMRAGDEWKIQKYLVQ